MNRFFFFSIHFLLAMVCCIDAPAGETNHDISVESKRLDNDALRDIKDYLVTRQFDKAEQICLQQIALASQDARIYDSLGFIYLHQTNYDKAIPVLQKAFNLGQVGALNDLYQVYLRSTNWSAIRSLVPLMLENKSKDPALVDDLLDATLRQHPPDKASIARAVEGLSNENIIQNHRRQVVMFIYAFDTMGDSDRARQLSKQFHEVRETEEDNKADKAYYFSKSECLRIIAKYEEDPAAWNNDDLVTVATAYFKDSQFEKAIAVYKKMMEFDSGDVHALLGLGNSLLCETNFEEAIIQYRKAWDLGAKNVAPVLAAAYLGARGDLGRMQDLIPELQKDRQVNLQLLAGYALLTKPPDTNLFLQTIDGMTDVELSTQGNTTATIIEGLIKSGETNRAAVIRNLQLSNSPNQGSTNRY
jgi:pentatricopeptide repeat protein